MTEYGAVPNKPTAKKVRDEEFYYPAITRAFGRPKALTYSTKYETRSKAKAAAKRILKAAVYKGDPS